jgi:hypothetical protein
MRRRWVGAVGAAVISWFALVPGMAGAAADPGWFEEQASDVKHAIVDYLYERSGHSLVPYSGSAAAVAEAMSESVVDAGAVEAPLAPEIAAEEFTVTRGVGLLPRLATVAPQVAAAAGTFGLGWAIGTGVRKLFLRFTGPDDSSENGAVTWSWLSLRWIDYGESVFFGATVQQFPGAYLYNSLSSAGAIRWFEEPCSFSGFAPARGARMETHVYSGGQCNEWSEADRQWHLYSLYVDYPYLLESDLKPAAPARPFDSETDSPDATTTTPPDPGVGAVEGDAGEALDGDGQELMRREWEWQTTPGSQAAEEPIWLPDARLTRPREDRECKEHFGDRPGTAPAERAPEANEEDADWDYDVDAFEEVFNPLTEGTQTVKLRWGTLAWGYRHIVEEHGWDAAAARRTRLALQTDIRPVLDTSHDSTRRSFVYFLNLSSPREGLNCRQRVAVSYRRDEVVPPGRHIITSFVEAY